MKSLEEGEEKKKKKKNSDNNNNNNNNSNNKKKEKIPTWRLTALPHYRHCLFQRACPPKIMIAFKIYRSYVAFNFYITLT